MDKAEYYWDRVKHEENLFTSRANFFLVAESMLFAGIATLFTANNSLAKQTAILFAIAGIVITLVWLTVSALQRWRSWRPANRSLIELKDSSELAAAHANLSTNTSGVRYELGRSATLIGIVLPLGLVVAWSFLLRFGVCMTPS